MKAFRYNTQTCVYYGRHSIAGHQDIFKEYGKKAVVVSSKFVKGCPNYARDDLKEIFRKLDMEFIILEDVVEDPPVENIVAMYEKLDGFTPDFLIGAGGGAALDAAKALAMLIGNPGKDPYDIFYGAGAPMNNFKNICDIPVFSVPTTAGTGSEVTGGAVLTRKDKQTKEAMYMWYYPEISFVDPRYIEKAPLFLLDTGAIDALAHGVKITGLTVHFVDAGVDTGPILAQAAVPVLDDDTEETLHERIKVQERCLLVQTIASLAESHGATSGS